MDALGLIETRGLLPAIEGADAMLKAANVRLLNRIFTGGGLVTIMILGDVGAVRASVDAGAAAVKRIKASLLISEHVIPRPHDQIGEILKEKKDDPGETESREKAENILKTEIPDLNREQLDTLFREKGLSEVLELIEKQAVVKLRKLAREYKDFGILGREISNAGKKQLTEEFRKYFSNHR